MRQLKITKRLTNRETASMDKYLQEIGRIEMITVEREVELAQIIRSSEVSEREREAAITELVGANLRFVVSVAKQYQNNGLALPDLINEGNFGLVKAAEKFDETRGFKFISYAVWWIRQSILQAINESARIIRLPLNQTSLINKYKKAFSKFEVENEQPPTTKEMTDILEMPIEKIRVVETLLSKKHSSLDETIPGTDDLKLGDVMSNELFRADDEVTQNSLKTEIDRALSSLDERTATILKLFFGLAPYPETTLEEIGEMFDLTRERVRQIKEKGLRLLRNTGRAKLLTQYL